MNPGGPGDAFYWVFMVASLLLIFLLANLAVLVHVARTRSRAPKIRLGAWLLVAALWLCAQSYDSHRSRQVAAEFTFTQPAAAAA